MRVVIVGNSSVGKSAILNAIIIGQPRFRSCALCFRSTTEVLQNEELNGLVYSETPGLNDIESREKAAGEISKAFQGGGQFKLIFVIQLEAGRLRPGDLKTIKTVLNEVHKVGIDTGNRFSVIVNKLEEEVLQALKRQENQARMMAMINGGGKAGHVGFMCLDHEAIGRDNYILKDHRRRLAAFVNEAPTFDLKPNNGVQIDKDSFERDKAYLERWRDKVYRSAARHIDSALGAVVGGLASGRGSDAILGTAGAADDAETHLLAKGFYKLILKK